MVRRYYDLPSLTALATFEASARHRSFKLAAAELNVTPSAISRQIKALEDEFSLPLFLRHTSGVELTPEGEDLYSVLSHGFARASEAVQRIKSGNRSQCVTLASTTAVALMWLMPRMGEFWREHPEIQVDHLISDNARDYRRADIDLRIRYGFGSWPDETATLLLRETIYPVAGPGFAAAHSDAEPQDIPALPLLHVGVDLERVDGHVLVAFLELVDADDDPRGGLDLLLLLQRRAGDLGLEPPVVDAGVPLLW